MEEGQYLLREERLTAAGFAYGSSDTLMPVWRLDESELRRGTLFRVPGERLMAAFERRLLHAPYAGISRIFLLPLGVPSRARSVRH